MLNLNEIIGKTVKEVLGPSEYSPDTVIFFTDETSIRIGPGSKLDLVFGCPYPMGSKEYFLDRCKHTPPPHFSGDPAQHACVQSIQESI